LNFDKYIAAASRSYADADLDRQFNDIDPSNTSA
jgi:hypothetical protein